MLQTNARILRDREIGGLFHIVDDHFKLWMWSLGRGRFCHVLPCRAELRAVVMPDDKFIIHNADDTYIPGVSYAKDRCVDTQS